MTSSSGAGASPCTPLQPAFHLPLQPCVTDRLAQSGPFESWRREKICRWRFRRCRRPSGSGWSQGTRRAWKENYFPSVPDVTQDSAWVTGAGEQLASLLSSERFLCLSVLFLIVLRTPPSQLVALVERKVGSGVLRSKSQQNCMALRGLPLRPHHSITFFSLVLLKEHPLFDVSLLIFFFNRNWIGDLGRDKYTWLSPQSGWSFLLLTEFLFCRNWVTSK